jgi:hypothetical protein
MIWIAYGLGFMMGLILLGIFALQVLYVVAEYHERTGEPCGSAPETEKSQIIIARHVENSVC